MSNDLIADLFTRIRNAQRGGHRLVRVRPSNVVKSVLDVLRSEGFIQSYEQKKDSEGKFPELEVALKYYSSGEPAISMLRRVSTSGRRVYRGVDNLPKIYNGLGICVLSTSQGVISDREARKRKVGGELLGYVG